MSAAPANRYDHALRGVFEARERDWRIGPVVYQVLVDRYAPSAALPAKAHLYPAPKRLRAWHELPRAGRYLDDQRVWSHEIDFWGGDLASVQGRLDHVQALGADVLYLNPIHLAATNHKYDALDYLSVSPEFGTRDDLRALARAVHDRGMRLVLDGVFNHMGRQAPIFQHALNDPQSPWREWFDFDPALPGGARCWANAQNLPELRLEHPDVQAHVWAGPDAAVRRFLRDGADGWRLDVAHDIGFDHLAAITHAAHEEKPGSLVLGEIAGYPQEWFPAVDGILGFALRQVVLGAAAGTFSPSLAARQIDRMVADTGIEPMLRSWLYLGNHDTPRLATLLPDARRRRLAQVLQFTLPGAPNLYYGDEVEMTGGGDPEMRAPMDWERVQAGHPALDWTRHLTRLRASQRALRVGNFRLVDSDRLLAFQRYTDRAGDGVFVFANPTDADVTETVLLPDSKMMDHTPMRDLLAEATGAEPIALRVQCALLTVHVPACSVRVLQPDVRPHEGYTTYKRVQ